MKLSEMFPSNYLKKEDLPTPRVVVIQNVTRVEMNDERGRMMKAVLHFSGDVKPLVLNKGNAGIIGALYGDDTTAWIGKSIEVYHDPMVQMKGKPVGGVRVRPPQQDQLYPPQHQNPIAMGQTTANGFGGSAPSTGPLWDISDGKTLIQKQTTAQIEAAIQELRDSGADPKTHKVRAHPSGNPVTADVWLQQLAAGRPQQVMNDPIPF